MSGMNKRRKEFKTFRETKIENLVDAILLHMNTKNTITLSGFDWQKYNNVKKGATAINISINNGIFLISKIN